MAGLAVIWGKSEDRRAAERARIEAEDTLMAVRPQERTHLSVFADAQAQRNLVFIARLRETATIVADKSNRNLWATIIIGVILIAKGIITPADVGHALTWLGQFF